MTTNLLSKVIQFAPSVSSKELYKTLNMSQNNEIMLYTSNLNQRLLPETGDSLALEAFFKEHSIPFKVCQICNGEDMSPDGILPFIVDNDSQIICGFEKIVQSILMLKGYDEQENFVKSSKVCAYQTLLHNSEEDYLWSKDDVYNNFTSQFYSYSKPWPVGPILAWTKRRQIRHKLSILEDFDSKSFAQTCERLIDGELHESNGETYLYGDTFTELDALVYGHFKAIKDFAQAGTIPELWDIIESHDKLLSYMNFIRNHLENIQRKEV